MTAHKPFLSYDQQIDKLVSEKNLTISNRQYAVDTLKQLSYYTLISGYKELFKNPTTKKYKDGTTFEEIVALYGFDKSLRELLLKYLLVFEIKMKSLLSYYFTEHFGENQSQYLSITNYSPDPSKARDITYLVSILEGLALRSNDYGFITYHRNKYGNVPLWVLIRVLTFGNISHFYDCLTHALQSKISKDFESVKEKELCQYLRALTKFRNACAHNDRLFSYRIKDDIPDTPLHKKLGIQMKGSQYLQGKKDLFSVVVALRYLLPKSEFYEFKRKLSLVIERFMNSTVHVTQNELLVQMGFPSNWKKVSAYKI